MQASIFHSFISFFFQEEPLEFLSVTFLSNTVEDYIVAAIAFIFFLVLFKIFQVIILNRLKKLAKRTKTDVDDTFIQIIQSVRPPFYFFLALYLALYFLTITAIVQKVINIVLIIWITYQVVIAVQILIDYIVKKQVGEDGEPTTKAAISLVGKITKGVLWMFGILVVLSNLGVNVTSLIAGLGIGGIAIALALQNILSDLFSSFAIYFDKPFCIGDFIVVGEHMGIVEKIGIKTTRIRALQGEEIVISNKELVSTRIQNFKKMQERRVVFTFGVVYQTPMEKLKKIPEIVKDIIEDMEMVRFDRVHFKKFDDSALTFEVVYYVESPDYLEYMNVNQAILFQIKERFEKEKIEMAYTTYTVYLVK